MLWFLAVLWVALAPVIAVVFGQTCRFGRGKPTGLHYCRRVT